MRFISRLLVFFLAAVGLVTVMSIAGSLWLVFGQPESPSKRILLTLDLDRGLAETAPGGLFGRFQLGDSYTLRDVLDGLERAAADERVTGLLVRLNGGELSMAKAQELREAVALFRQSGKPAVLFSESIGGDGNGTVPYYLATAFEQVWLQPSGDLSLAGFSAETPFLRGTLDQLGIEPQFGARHEFKSAIESFTEKGYSAANRAVIEKLLSSWTGQVIDAVAAARDLPAAKVRELMDRAPLMPNEALAERLIDRIGYWDEAEAALNAQDKETMDLAKYMARTEPDEGAGAKVALIYGVGTVQAREEGTGPFDSSNVMSAEVMAKALREAAEDDEVRAILIRIDSPGGSYTASDTIWRAVMKAREAGKPVVVSMGGMAASGGYFVAMAADRIVANPGTITGSIGVFAGKFVLRDFWDKIGVRFDNVTIGANAGMWSYNLPFSDGAWQRLQLQLDRIYADFTGKVAKARNLDNQAIDAVARGRVWSGADAKQVGLVDELGGFRTALAAVRDVAGLEKDSALDLVAFPKQKRPLAALAEALESGRLPKAREVTEGLATLTRLAGVLEPLVRQLEATASRHGELRAPLTLPTSER